jgi:hypothetical protein
MFGAVGRTFGRDSVWTKRKSWMNELDFNSVVQIKGVIASGGMDGFLNKKL